MKIKKCKHEGPYPFCCRWHKRSRITDRIRMDWLQKQVEDQDDLGVYTWLLESQQCDIRKAIDNEISKSIRL